MSEKFVVKLKHQLDKNSQAVFFEEWSIFYLSWKQCTLDLGSIANIDQHKLIFPTVYSMMGFGKKKSFIKFGALPQQPARKKIVDILFFKTLTFYPSDDV